MRRCQAKKHVLARNSEVTRENSGSERSILRQKVASGRCRARSNLFFRSWFLMTAVALLATMIAAAEAARTDLISVLHSEQGFANCRSHRLLTSTRARREHDARAGCTHRLAHAFIRPHSSLPLAAAGFNAKADRLKKFGRGCRAYVLKPWHKV